MKTQMQKPSAGKSHYTAEYKEDAVKHWRDSGRSAVTVAAELGIRAPLLSAQDAAARQVALPTPCLRYPRS